MHTVTAAQQRTSTLPVGARTTINVGQGAARQTVSIVVLGTLADGRVHARVARLNDTHQTATVVGDEIAVPRAMIGVWNSPA